MSCHRGKHRKSKRPLRVIAPGVTTAALTGMILTPLAASAQVVPDPSPSAPPDLASNTALIQRYLPRHQGNTEITVKKGDTLGDISLNACGIREDWTGIYKKNKKIIGDNYNLIIPGQKLEKDCRTAVIPQITVVTSAVQYTPRHASSSAGSYRSSGSYGNVNPGNYSGFQRCVITRESGGNSQVMNSSGHYGLYQFSASTWQAYGGSASDFGHASASEQTRVFDNAMARGGQSNWSPYDGC